MIIADQLPYTVLFKPLVPTFYDTSFEGYQAVPGEDWLFNNETLVQLRPVDSDDDGVPDSEDNCPTVANPDQANFDGDALGDACDPDDDNDGQSDVDELSCGSDPLDATSTSPDFDGDGIPDCVDFDDDDDGVLDPDDVCPGTVIPDPVIPTSGDLGVNRYAFTDNDLVFDTRSSRNTGAVFTTTDTGGCNATQIADTLGLGRSHYQNGITRSVLEAWIASLNS